MASAHRYTWTRTDGSRGEAWRAKWIGADGQPRSKRGFDLERTALAYAGDREAEARHGVTLGGERPTGRTTVSAWAAGWLEAQEVRPSTLEVYRYAVARVEKTFGGRTLASLRPSELKAWRKGLTARYAPSTAELTADVFAMLLRAAVDDGVLEQTPMPRRRGGRSDGRVVDPDELLTLDQVHSWGSRLPPVARELPLVAATTGLRQGELLGLQLHRVDFLRREVLVDPDVGQLVTPPGAGRPTFGPPKTPAAVRSVPLPAMTADAINRHLEVQPAEAGEPLFRSVRGYRWRRATFGDVWRQARDDAGLPRWVHWHSLRDVYASSLIASGEDVRTVMALLGHASSEETLRTYARLWPKSRDRARASLERLWTTSEDHGRATEG